MPQLCLRLLCAPPGAVLPSNAACTKHPARRGLCGVAPGPSHSPPATHAHPGVTVVGAAPVSVSPWNFPGLNACCQLLSCPFPPPTPCQPWGRGPNWHESRSIMRGGTQRGQGCWGHAGLVTAAGAVGAPRHCGRGSVGDPCGTHQPQHKVLGASSQEMGCRGVPFARIWGCAGVSPARSWGKVSQVSLASLLQGAGAGGRRESPWDPSCKQLGGVPAIPPAKSWSGGDPSCKACGVSQPSLLQRAGQGGASCKEPGGSSCKQLGVLGVHPPRNWGGSLLQGAGSMGGSLLQGPGGPSNKKWGDRSCKELGVLEVPLAGNEGIPPARNKGGGPLLQYAGVSWESLLQGIWGPSRKELGGSWGGSLPQGMGGIPPASMAQGHLSCQEPGCRGSPGRDPVMPRGGGPHRRPPSPPHPHRHSLSEEPLHVAELPPGELAELPGGAEDAATAPGRALAPYPPHRAARPRPRLRSPAPPPRQLLRRRRHGARMAAPPRSRSAPGAGLSPPAPGRAEPPAPRSARPPGGGCGCHRPPAAHHRLPRPPHHRLPRRVPVCPGPIQRWEPPGMQVRILRIQGGKGASSAPGPPTDTRAPSISDPGVGKGGMERTHTT